RPPTWSRRNQAPPAYITGTSAGSAHCRNRNPRRSASAGCASTHPWHPVVALPHTVTRFAGEFASRRRVPPMPRARRCWRLYPHSATTRPHHAHAPPSRSNTSRLVATLGPVALRIRHLPHLRGHPLQRRFPAGHRPPLPARHRPFPAFRPHGAPGAHPQRLRFTRSRPVRVLPKEPPRVHPRGPTRPPASPRRVRVRHQPRPIPQLPQHPARRRRPPPLLHPPNRVRNPDHRPPRNRSRSSRTPATTSPTADTTSGS